MLMSIQYPWALLLLAMIPAVLTCQKKICCQNRLFLGFGARPEPAARADKSMARSACRAAMILIVFAIANVQYSSYWQKTFLESRWIMLVQDLSGSMGRPGDESGRVTLGDVALEGAHALLICATRTI